MDVKIILLNSDLLSKASYSFIITDFTVVLETSKTLLFIKCEKFYEFQENYFAYYEVWRCYSLTILNRKITDRNIVNIPCKLYCY